MMYEDHINTLFEGIGALIVARTVAILHKQKRVSGVSWVHAGFFWLWGLWNVLYYPLLGQYYSALAAVLLTLANTVWLIQLFIYRRNAM